MTELEADSGHIAVTCPLFMCSLRQRALDRDASLRRWNRRRNSDTTADVNPPARMGRRGFPAGSPTGSTGSGDTVDLTT